MPALGAAHRAALEFRQTHPRAAAAQLRQARFFLTWDGLRFSPANRCLSWLAGIGFDQPAPSGRETARRSGALAGHGMMVFRPGNSRFATLLDALDADCRRLDGARGLGSHHGADRQAGKEIWLPHPDTGAMRAAFSAFDSGGAPDGFGAARSWFVADPETGRPYPAKIVWGLATGQTGADFTAHAARDGLRRLGLLCARLTPEELPPPATVPLMEGAERQATTSSRERNPVARRLCIEHHSRTGRLACTVCDMDFAETYGDLGAGFIHVHHLDQLADATGTRAVDPIRDLVPVCPNCHAMIHRGGRNRPLESVRRALRQARP